MAFSPSLTSRFVTEYQNIIQNVSLIYSYQMLGVILFFIHFLRCSFIHSEFRSCNNNGKRSFSNRTTIPASCFISVSDQIWNEHVRRIGTCCVRANIEIIYIDIYACRMPYGCIEADSGGLTKPNQANRSDFKFR